MSTRPDNRLADAPMHELACRTCAASVSVRKSSWDQTSIQWHDGAMAACMERRAGTPGAGPNGVTFRGCHELRDTIRAAAVNGELEVQSDEPLPVNPAAALAARAGSHRP